MYIHLFIDYIWDAVMFAADTATPNQQLLDELHKPVIKKI